MVLFKSCEWKHNMNNFVSWTSMHTTIIYNHFCWIYYACNSLTGSCQIHLFVGYRFRDTWTSSSVRPLVSGTSFATNTMVRPHMLENMKKVPGQKQHINELVQHLISILSAWGTRSYSEPTCWTPTHEEVKSIWYNPRTQPVNRCYKASSRSLHIDGKYLVKNDYRVKMRT